MLALKNVITLKPSTYHHKKLVLPPYELLSILAKAEITVPCRQLSVLLEKSVAEGLCWPTDLAIPLDKIFRSLVLKIELRQLVDGDLSVHEINEAITTLRLLGQAKESEKVAFILSDWCVFGQHTELEKRLGVNFTNLYSKVPINPDLKHHYFITVFVNIPKRIEIFIKKDKSKNKPKENIKENETHLCGFSSSNNQFTLRKEPRTTAPNYGMLYGDVQKVNVLNKKKTKEQNWTKSGRIQVKEYDWLFIETQSPIRTKEGCLVPAKTQCWILRPGLDMIYGSWGEFACHLKDLELENSQPSLDATVTRLRQLSHEKGLPFDKVIDTSEGKKYIDSINEIETTWQLYKDYSAFLAKDNRIIDFHHLIVGLDVIHRHERMVSYYGINIGTNWAAATWSGDIGAGIADKGLFIDSNWEERSKRSSIARNAHYMSLRASSWDLLADIDTWYFKNLGQLKGKTLLQKLSSYYLNTTDGVIRPLMAYRKDAIRRFVTHYGFVEKSQKYQENDANFPSFINKKEAMKRVKEELRSFADIWHKYRLLEKITGLELKKLNMLKFSDKDVEEMALLFVYWLEIACIENGIK